MQPCSSNGTGSGNISGILWNLPVSYTHLLPIAPVCVEAMKKGADEMGVKETFRGYEDSGSGYDFLKEAIAGYYKKFGVSLELDEIRVNDGAKSDCGNIVDIFGDDNIVLITDPAYPVYVDSNKMNGRTVILSLIHI